MAYPSVYLDRPMTPNSFMFRGICLTEVYDKTMSLKIQVGIRYSKKMHKIRSMVFNQSLLQGIFPEKFKVQKSHQ